ncbi:putative palmitylated virion envelope protein [Lumpy skin disease virus]|uniref:Palmitylated virion envelope protein n=2 Tax=Capripoxvirus TaxID=10265 RepID=Q91MX9_LSDV|nr:palmytilated EEV membrane glycoprotein [Lumpy skin disease virus NI-2490]AAN02596.1 putative palmitylated virion envelope protein [Lumpy skin disease virus NW-LW]AFX59018.1 F13L [Goatpox virus]AOE47604.1 palmytilated EEV membrane glycoprotein [Lumpy skin disease virus]AAK84989.1 LSDV028 putative palmitylated virion envelope protein [Lumpy skin disease virus NI-2490]ARO77336.1 putative palmitylated virion envelope protein [Lumpy skin disease virus]
MWSLFFSKPPSGAGCRLVETLPKTSGITTQHMLTHECFDEIISQAKKNINIASFCCNLRTSEHGKNILNKLKEAAASGIKVTILVDHQSGNKDEEELISNKIEYVKVKIGGDNDPGVLLGSFWVSDYNKCYIGNASLTGGSISNIKTLGIYSTYAPLALDLQRRFETFKALNNNSSIFRGIYITCCLPVSTKYHINNPIGGVFLSDSPDHILGYSRTLDADVVLSKINSAKKSIDLELLSLVPVIREDLKTTFWPDIYNAIIGATINRGVKVRLLVGSWDKNDVYVMSSVKSLQSLCSNNDLTVKIFHDTNNTKLMIIDNEFAHITPANFDGTHYLHYAFVSFNTNDNELVKMLSNIFERDWSDKKNTVL